MTMYWIAVFGVVGLIVSLVLTPVVREFMMYTGILDQPDNIRRFHDHPTPRLGGVAVFLSYAAVLADLRFFSSSAHGTWLKDAPVSWLTIVAVVIIFATGLVDDLFGLKPWQKLTGQLTGTVIAFFSGVQIHAIQTQSLDMWWSLPLTVVWLLVCTNAFNLIDGLDGLATGIGLLAASTMTIAALLHGNTALLMLTVPLCGVLLGFLRYNFNPASIFLGDSGSLTLGFLLGCFGVLWSQKSATLLGMTAPLMALAVPLIDVGVAIVRRFIRRQPIFSGDRGHMHHRLLALGLTPRRAVLLVYCGCAVAAASALLTSAATSGQLAGLVTFLFCIGACLAVRNLRFAEFDAAGKLLLEGRFRNVIDAEMRLRNLRDKLAQATTLQDWWEAVCVGRAEFGLAAARLHFDGRILEDGSTTVGPCWQIRVPLEQGQYVNFYSMVNSGTDIKPLREFVASIESSLRGRQFVPEAAVILPAPAKHPTELGSQSPDLRIHSHLQY